MKRLLRRTTLATLLIAALPGVAVAAPKPASDDAIRKLEASFDPPTARPGQTVTFKIALELNPGWHVYPTIQPDPAADAKITNITFTAPKGLSFAGPVKNPPGFKTQSEETVRGQAQARIYEGKVVWERRVKVPTDAKPGDKSIQALVDMQVCNKEGCRPSKPRKLDAVLKVTADAAAPVGDQKDDDLFGPKPGEGKQRRGDTVGDLIDIKVNVSPPQARAGEIVKVTLTGTLKKGYHTYPVTRRTADQEGYPLTKISFANNANLRPLWPVTESAAEFEKVPTIGVFLVHNDKVTWSQDVLILPKAKPGEQKLGIKINLQVCDKRGCIGPDPYPPLEAIIKVADGPAVPLTPALEERLKADPPEIEVVPVPADFDSADASKDGDGLLAFILQGILWGAISLLTPCVFPMIPITVSYFLKQSEKEHHRPIGMALVYSLTIVVVLTIGAVLLLGFFQAASQHWATNLFLAALFVFFALSLFGMYEITLPSGLANFTTARQGQGGMAGTMFMALTFSIISFSCVAPFLGGFAALVPSFGNVLDMIKAGGWGPLMRIFGKLLLGALAFSVTFASPFFVLALFPSLLKTLPKSGSWMNTVKVVMGFLEVAAGIKFLRAAELLAFGQAQILTYDLAIGLYIALSLACGLYLLGLFRLPHDDPPAHLGVPRMVVSLLFIGLGLYLLPGQFKLDARERQRPSGVVFAWLDSFLLPDVANDHFASLEAGLNEARDKRKLVFVDFTGLS
jgi:thiol:disulfide interchange protein DsbD